MVISLRSEMQTPLEEMWAAHSGYLRRLLIGLTRDIDLADDLLQETYLRARHGMEGYRGGDARAWLAAIARNAFNAHARRKYFGSEVPLDDEPQSGGEAGPGSPGHVTLLALRQAISDLPDQLRTALMMRHYGGLDYGEIARRMSCPQGTARQRVWTAVQRLKTALGEVAEEMIRVTCGEISGRKLLDYVYGKLPRAETKAMEEHISGCKICRGQVDEIGGVLRALDAVESDYKFTGIVEIDKDDLATFYMLARWVNDSEQPLETLHAGVRIDDLAFVSVQGEEAAIERTDAPDGSQGWKQYLLRPVKPIQPGERVDMLMVGKPVKVTEDLDGGRRAVRGQLNFDVDTFYVMAARLPPGTTLTAATPEPSETHTDGTTTVIWRDLLRANERVEFRAEFRVEE